jgi:hypothetical protein
MQPGLAAPTPKVSHPGDKPIDFIQGSGHRGHPYGCFETVMARSDETLVKSTVPQEMWGAIADKLDQPQHQHDALDVQTDAFDLWLRFRRA